MVGYIHTGDIVLWGLWGYIHTGDTVLWGYIHR